MGVTNNGAGPVAQRLLVSYRFSVHYLIPCIIFGVCQLIWGLHTITYRLGFSLHEVTEALSLEEAPPRGTYSHRISVDFIFGTFLLPLFSF